MNQDEIEIVDVEKELNQSNGVNVGPFSDFSDNSDLDIEIIEVVNNYEDFKCGWPTRDCWRVALKLLEVDILVSGDSNLQLRFCKYFFSRLGFMYLIKN